MYLRVRLACVVPIQQSRSPGEGVTILWFVWCAFLSAVAFDSSSFVRLFFHVGWRTRGNCCDRVWFTRARTFSDTPCAPFFCFRFSLLAIFFFFFVKCTYLHRVCVALERSQYVSRENIRVSSSSNIKTNAKRFKSVIPLAADATRPCVRDSKCFRWIEVHGSRQAGWFFQPRPSRHVDFAEHMDVYC